MNWKTGFFWYIEIKNIETKKYPLFMKEKETLVHDYENEEEFLTNDLSRKLTQLRNEKKELERTLEMEQQKQVSKLLLFGLLEIRMFFFICLN